jgi:polyvinyl alcohol dehydrogenase (cytochrome)
MIGFRSALLGLSIALCGAVWLAGCDDDTNHPTPAKDLGKAPTGSCKQGSQAACEGSDCGGGRTALATCGSNEKWGACKCTTKTGKGEDGGGGDDAGSDAAMSGGDAGGGSADGKSTTGGTWPMMGYDETNTYFNPNEKTLSPANAKKLVELWRFQVAGYPPGTPVVGDGKVFVMATGGTYAIDEKTGEQVWANTEIIGTASAAYADGAVYVHSAPGTDLYKLDAKTGDIKWGPVATYNQGACDGTSSPIVAGGMVFVGHACGTVEATGAAEDLAASRGGVEAFDADSGDHVWTYWTVPDENKGKEDGAMVWSTVTVDVDGGAVYAATGNSYSMTGEHSDSIHAMNLKDGNKQWHTQVREGDIWSLGAQPGGPDTDFGANPILAEVGGKKIVADGDKGAAFWAMDRATGQILWSRPDLSASRDQAHGGMLMNGAFDGKNFYVVSNQPSDANVKALLHAMDASDKGKDVWKPVEYGKYTWGAPSLANGLLVVPNDDDLHVLEADTGKELIMFNTGGTIAAGAAAIVDGRIIVSSGLQYIFDSTTKNNNLVICYGLK